MAHSGALRRYFAGLFVALATTFALSACGGPTEIKANSNTIAATVTVYALNGPSAVHPAALALVRTPAAVRMTPDYQFDLAVDFDASGAARLIPVDLVASAAILPPTRKVGMQKIDKPYDDITRAPDGGYVNGAALPIAVGDVGVIQSLNHPFCANAFFVAQHIYAKFIVDAIDPVARSVRLRVLVDPNCGFRGLETGTLPSR